MFVAHGWLVIQAARSKYLDPHSMGDAEMIDEQLNEADNLLWREFRDWAESNLDVRVKWQFTERLNNHRGLFQFHTSRNHGAGSSLWDLLDFVRTQSRESSGVIFTHDEEETEPEQGVFRIWRILEGQRTEHPDFLFSAPDWPNAFGDHMENYTDSHER